MNLGLQITDMRLRTKGTSVNIEKPIIGKVTRSELKTKENSILIVDKESQFGVFQDCDALLTTSKDLSFFGSKKIVHSIPNLDHLSEGDIVALTDDGLIETLYRPTSPHNTLLSTERCNSNCLMCSQPPKNRNDIEKLFYINSQLLNLIPKDCEELGISGGEPTLLGEYFFNILNQIKEKLPDTEIHVLTNGRTFAWEIMARRLFEIGNNRIMLGVPVYADYYQTHDYIVQARNAFYQTIRGLHNLAKYNQRIEIRIVLHKQTIPRLRETAKFIYKNLPFAEHVAFMGLEHIGYTKHNMEKLWMDPSDYMNELFEAVNYLAVKGMNVSIYNTQLCVLPNELWKFARKSISDWKNEYLQECKVCSKREECGGFFTWNLVRHSEKVKAFI
ncbi:His-Xaa-Ser system radical SAM maturase HxsC [Leptospira interrogans]|uniref:His-Xaa-Ser system radical SAM maturase HxsC n=2 Tax=Leptospira interrogans TaxID=173 RepID=UPI002015EE71|nr:His-Xaa-Ser system radical SAM maturase HxsC [Leptospira interrogans]